MGSTPLGGRLSLNAARAVSTSPRTLTRRLHAVIGKSPLSYFQDLRVERAVHLLQTSDHSVDQIASQVGYASGVHCARSSDGRSTAVCRELRGHDSNI